MTDDSKSVLYSTHITSDLDKTADYITFIMDGRIVYSGAKEALLDKYARVTGGLGEISAEQRSLVIGYREHSIGFEGLVESANISKLPRGVLTERATLEEIIIFINKGAKMDE